MIRNISHKKHTLLIFLFYVFTQLQLRTRLDDLLPVEFTDYTNIQYDVER